MKAGVAVEFDGKMIDLSEVDWMQVAPCGCVCGVTLAYCPPLGIHSARFVVSAEQAACEFSENRADREQHARRGFTYRLGRRGEAVDAMQSKCPHTPKWGYERPIPEGMVYAPTRWGSGKVLHLVPKSVDYASGGSGEASPLCGGRPAYGWDSRFGIELPDCEKCIKAALAMRTEVTS